VARRVVGSHADARDHAGVTISATKAGFLSANQTEVFCFVSLAIRNRKDDLYPKRFNELIFPAAFDANPLSSTTEHR